MLQCVQRRSSASFNSGMGSMKEARAYGSPAGPNIAPELTRTCSASANCRAKSVAFMPSGETSKKT